MENLFVADTSFAPGQNVTITGKPGTGKTMMAKRFAAAARDIGATVFIVTDNETLTEYRQHPNLASAPADVMSLLSRTMTDFGQIVLVVDRKDLSDEARELILRASERDSVTVAQTTQSLPDKDLPPNTHAVIATGVHQLHTTAKEVFDHAAGRKVRAHANWQCAIWHVAQDHYKIIDL